MPSAPVPVGPPAARGRARDLGLRIGLLPSGPTASIVDVPGVRVGHATVWRDEPPPPLGRGVARTGVTAILPAEPASLFHARVPAGGAVLNGAGEAIGLTGIREWGLLESPILLTSTLAIGRVYDATVELLTELDPAIGRDDVLIPCVAECDDARLNDARTVQVAAADVRAAVEGARGAEAGASPVGAVGAGTGMICCQLKGGIGSASRIVPLGDASWTVGVLVLANFGRLERLTVDGVRVGETLAVEGWPAAGLPRGTHLPGRAAARGEDQGSCIVVVATDAPLLGAQLERLARRAGLGLARVGSFAGHGSGEIFLACSTGLRVPRGGPALVEQRHVADEALDPLFAAVVEATEEAVLDSLVAADTVTGRDGATVPALPLERTVELLRAAGRPATLATGVAALP
ncbi:MAG TPA: P1 family peptidase [Candidatus Limnocylindrales bacterium]